MKLKHSWRKTAVKRDDGTLLAVKKCQYCHCIRYSNNVCHRRDITYFGPPPCFKSKLRTQF